MKSAAQIARLQSLRQERRAHQRARFGMVLAALLALLVLTALVVKCQESLLP